MNNMEELPENAQYGIVELMGHKIVAGLVSNHVMGSAALLRVDVPATSAFPGFTQLYGTAAIYCVTFVSEEVARKAAEATKVNPVSVYVPDLVTREQMEKTVQTWKDEVTRLRNGLPEPSERLFERVDDDDLLDLGDDEDDDDDEEL